MIRNIKNLDKNYLLQLCMYVRTMYIVFVGVLKHKPSLCHNPNPSYTIYLFPFGGVLSG